MQGTEKRPAHVGTLVSQIRLHPSVQVVLVSSPSNDLCTLGAGPHGFGGPERQSDSESHNVREILNFKHDRMIVSRAYTGRGRQC